MAPNDDFPVPGSRPSRGFPPRQGSQRTVGQTIDIPVSRTRHGGDLPGFHLEQGSTARGGATVTRRRIYYEDLQASLNAEYDELSAIGYARLSRWQMDRLHEILQELNEIDRINQDSGWA